MRYIALAALLLALPVQAESPDMLFDNGHVAVRLTPHPCAYPPLAAILADAAPGPSFTAIVTFQGTETAACWVFLPEDRVGILDGDGESGVIPMGAFKPAP